MRDINRGKGLDELSLWGLYCVYDKNKESWPAETAAQVAYALSIGLERTKNNLKEENAIKNYTALSKGFRKECLQFIEASLKNTGDVPQIYKELIGVDMSGYLTLKQLCISPELLEIFKF